MRGAPAEPITHRTWTDEWVTVRCGACHRLGQWPQPELGCPCGAVLRVPVRPVTTTGPSRIGGPVRFDPPGSGTARRDTAGDHTTGAGAAAPGPATAPDTTGGASGQPPGQDPSGPPEATASTTGVSTVHTAPVPPPPPPVARPAFHPVTIRTARDAVTTAALYLRWLGFREVVQPEERRAAVSSGIELRGPGLVAQVDPTTRPVALRAVECLWLEGLAAAAVAVCFSLAGYEDKARARADGVGLPLFVMDLTGTPQPVNSPADDLLARGA
ncbi:hypothetical protein [Streptomyces kanasensis]|uniref:hypothetical protein n=1 Tax=Streptomyces kanasensis TaxID=936756 RepID=UPI0036FA0175